MPDTKCATLYVNKLTNLRSKNQSQPVMLPVCFFDAACAASTAPKPKHCLLDNPRPYHLHYVCWVQPVMRQHAPHLPSWAPAPKLCLLRHITATARLLPQPLPAPATRLLPKLSHCAPLVDHTVCSRCSVTQSETSCLVTQCGREVSECFT